MKKIAAIAVLALVASASMAQTLSSSYFIEGVSQRYQMNPAFAPERDITLAIPVLSNLQIGAGTSFGLSNFIYESQAHPDKLTTFMSSEVDRDAFMKALSDPLRLNLGLNMDILAIGFGGENSYTNVSLRLHNDESLYIPKELLGFMKAGLSNGTYLIEDFNLNSTTYAELALNHSRTVFDALRVGATFKFLTGLEYVDLNIDRIDADFSEEAWKVRTNASLMESIPGGKVKYNEADRAIDGFEYSFQIPQSHGMGLDLGAEYDLSFLVDGLKLSASVTDLGFITWKNVGTFTTKNEEYITFQGFSNYDVMGSDDNGANVIEQLKDDFSEMVKLYGQPDSKQSVSLRTTMRAGAQYTLPWVKWISCGELLTLRPGRWQYFESRTSVDLAPLDWIDFSGNLAFSSYGTTGGVVASIHPAVMTLFVSCDIMKTRLNRQYIPMDKFGLNVNIGLNMSFGEKHDR